MKNDATDGGKSDCGQPNIDTFIRRERGNIEITVIADAITWMAVHGSLELALRHPANVGPSTSLVAQLSSALLRKLYNVGFLTAEGFYRALKDEDRAVKRARGR